MGKKKLLIISLIMLNINSLSVFALNGNNNTEIFTGADNIETKTGNNNLSGEGLSMDDDFYFDDDLSEFSGELLSGDIEILSGGLKELSGEDNKVVKTKTRTQLAIEDFRERKMGEVKKLYENNSFNLLVDVQRSKQQLEVMSTELKKIVSDFEKVRKRKDRVDGEYTGIKSTIKDTIEDIKVNEKMVNERLIKIKLYTKKLTELKSEIKLLKMSIYETKDYLANYTNLLYKINNDFYGKDFKIDDLKLLIKSENIANSLSTEDIIQALTLKLDELLTIMNAKEKKVISYSMQLNELKVTYIYEVKDFNKDLGYLNQQKKYLAELLKFFKLDKLENDREYKRLVVSKKNLKKQILSLLVVTKDMMDVDEYGSGIDVRPLLRIAEKPDSDTFFSWPVLPPYRISTYFDDPNYKKKFGVLHKAIDIATPQGSEIYAPANAMVYKVVDQDGPGLNRLILFHKYGYVTIYLHMNRILVKEGDFVRRGQLIGLSGGRPGTRGAGLMSTGPHLHFEIIKNGGYLDPLKYMDLSVMKSKSYLNIEYRLKYIKDKYSRNIDLTDISFASGNTVQQRRIEFLKSNAVGEFRDISLWEDAAKGKAIDIDLGICIGFAETGLGKYYAKNSNNNVGNVGNNDRGNKITFESPLKGAEAIFNALNNQYLINNHTIDQLSRYNNSDGSIYASDPVRWQKNVLKCLSKIKGYWVAEDYPFRLYEEPEIDDQVAEEQEVKTDKNNNE